MKVPQKLKKPEWIKIRPPSGENYKAISQELKKQNLHTVCEEALCPNLSECWSGGTATLMLLGSVCTRGCRFCAVDSGNPKGVLDLNEPFKSAQTVKTMNLDYVVLTMVNRDDLPDGGAAHVAFTIEKIRELNPEITIETLVSDFQNNDAALKTLCQTHPEVLAHNLETVERLTSKVRDARATYAQSLDVLQKFKKLSPQSLTKSSLMLGLGETDDEIEQALKDLRAHWVDVVTLGQYLQPSPKHLPVESFIPPEKFEFWKSRAEALGFVYTASGPLVRSSYRAGEHYVKGLIQKRSQPLKIELPYASI